MDWRSPHGTKCELVAPQFISYCFIQQGRNSTAFITLRSNTLREGGRRPCSGQVRTPRRVNGREGVGSGEHTAVPMKVIWVEWEAGGWSLGRKRNGCLYDWAAVFPMFLHFHDCECCTNIFHPWAFAYIDFSS